MLTHTKISFAIKFSTHSKDVSICVLDNREQYILNHAERHYKTGYTVKKRDHKQSTRGDLTSVGGPS